MANEISSLGVIGAGQMGAGIAQVGAQAGLAVTVFDLEKDQVVFSVNFSLDIRNAIHGLEVWPHPLPA